MASGLITLWQTEAAKMEAVTDFIFGGSKSTADRDCSHEIKRRLLLGRKAMTPRQHIKKQRHHFADRSLYNQSYGFSSSHVQMWELDRKEGWVLKNWCFWTVVLEKTFESPLDSKAIKPVHPKGNQSWIFIGSADAEAEAPMWRCEEPTHWKIPWCWKRLKTGGEGDDIGWNGWVTSLTQWIWVCASSRRWWRTGKPGVLQSMELQSLTHLIDWTTTMYT